MAGMSHGGGEAKPAVMADVPGGGGMSGSGMGGGLPDFFLQSSITSLFSTYL
jgi:hypothetical protein